MENSIKTMPKNITFINTTDETEFQVAVGMLNGIRYTKLNQIESTFQDTKKLATLIYQLSNIDLTENISELESESLKPIFDGIKTGSINITDLQSILEMSGSVNLQNLERRKEIIKVMIDDKKLSDEHKAIIDSENFWDYQDIEYIIELSEFFRRTLRK